MSDKDKHFAESAPRAPTPRSTEIGGLPASDALSRSEAQMRRDLADEAQQINGGTGRPVQRGRDLSGVFTFNKGNDAYLTGRSGRPVSGALGLIGAGVVALILQGGFLFITSRSSRNNDSAGFIAVIGVATMIFLLWAAYQFYDTMRFHRSGTLLLGQIQSASGRWAMSGSSKNRDINRNFSITLNYRVRLPNGEVLDHSVTQVRNDLSESLLPLPGAPIAVLALPGSNKIHVL